MAGFLPGDSSAMQSAVAMLRLYLRDYPVLNRLIEGEESTDRMLAWAILDVLDDFNTSPPLLGRTPLATFPSPSLLRMGAASLVMESVAILAQRNYINFTDGGTSVSFTANIPHIKDMSRVLWDRYEQKKLKLKVALNIGSAFDGGVHSEYYLIGGWGWYGLW